MSNKAMGWAWEFKLQCLTKMVLLYIADSHNGTTGRCFPSIKTIAENCGASVSAVKKHVSILENSSIISRTRRTHQGRNTSSEFTLNFDLTPSSKSRDVAFVKAVTWPPINQEEELTGKEYVPSEHIGAAHPVKRLQRIGVDPYAGLHDRPKKEIQPAHIPASLAPCVDKWGTVAMAHGEKTKALREGVRAMRQVVSGKFFLDKNGYAAKARPYTPEQISRAMDVFNTMRNDSDYLPANKQFLKRLSLADFFYSPHMRNGNGGGGGSMFLQCRANPPVLVADTDPDMTKFVRRIAHENLGTPVAEEPAARAASKFNRYWREREAWLKGHGVATPKRLVVTWMEMLNLRYGGEWDIGNVLGRGMNDVYEKYIGGMA